RTDTLNRISDNFVLSKFIYYGLLASFTRREWVYPASRLALRGLRSFESKKSIDPSDLPPEFSVICGHFMGGRFEEILPPEAASYISVVRNPLDRRMAHFRHWQRTHGRANFRLGLPYKPDVDFQHFAFLPELQNYQATTLQIDPERYRCIGTLEHFPEFLEELGCTPNTNKTPHIGKTNRTSPIALPQGFVSQFEDFHRADYELYQRTLETWR